MVILISCSPGQPERTTNFPKLEWKASWNGKKENLWVFIMAGQSNMAGRGFVEPLDTISDNRILTINKEGEIILAREPIHFYEPNLAGLDCGHTFGMALLTNLPDSISVLILPTAIGGSSISQWLGDSTHRQVKLLSNFRDKVALGAKVGTIRAILWHQGESDAHQETIPLYEARLGQLLSLFRKEVGNDSLPILIGELGAYSKDQANWMAINQQIRKYCASDLLARIIVTADLHHKGDSVHFDAEGQRIMGRRFAANYWKTVNSKY